MTKLPQFSDTKVLVIGDVMLDRFWHGAATRISPEAPVPIVDVVNVDDRPGGAGNVAINLAALDVETTLSGRPVVSDTLPGRYYRQATCA